MERYYFDTRDNDTFVADDIGVELTGDEAARDQAAVALAEMAKDVLPGSLRRTLSIEVRGEGRGALMAARLIFEVERLS